MTKQNIHAINRIANCRGLVNNVFILKVAFCDHGLSHLQFTGFSNTLKDYCFRLLPGLLFGIGFKVLIIFSTGIFVQFVFGLLG